MKFDSVTKSWNVIEKFTGYVILNTKSRTQAEKLFKNLKSGVGFQGFTPMYILDKNIQNDEFIV